MSKCWAGSWFFRTARRRPLILWRFRADCCWRFIKVIHSSRKPGTTLVGTILSIFWVSSIAKAKAALEKKGVNFPDPIKPAGGGGRVLFFRDAEDNLLHLVERPRNSIFRRPL